jgi:HD-GYP domain-containing protein (c-di-GMP phosphodiesterase class II)
MRESYISLFDLIMSLSDAMDLISPAIVNHHKQVAYIAYSIGEEMSLSTEEKNELILAGLSHDIGAFSLKERLSVMQFEIDGPHTHARLGSSMLRMFKPFSRMATLVKFHHVPWDSGAGTEFDGEEVPTGSHLLHLADRVAVLIKKEQEILGQVKSIRDRISEESGKMFMPEAVDAFLELAAKECFWLDTFSLSRSISSLLQSSVRTGTIEMNLDCLISLSKLFSEIIDFRSPFTATHSSGVAACAESIAEFAGFSERECRMMRIAGYLHDMGKLAVPKEILEKPARLTAEEFNVIRSHTYHTYRTLETMGDLDIINTWASFHHERMDGTGYPFHLKGQDLSLGSRIMAVADVFTAITEDRPYRKGMDSSSTLKVLHNMAKSALDPGIVSILADHFDEINSSRIAAQEPTAREYQEIMRS